MTKSTKTEQRWLNKHVEKYLEMRPQYEEYSKILREILKHASKNLIKHSVVQIRVKSVNSFKEKALRMKDNYKDPVNQITDLCGARVIVHKEDEIDIICEYIKEKFLIDWDNSSNNIKLSSEGNGSFVYYAIKPKPDVFPIGGIDGIPDKFSDLKAEIQVMTMKEWLQDQVKRYSEKHSLYKEYALLLENIMEQASLKHAPLSIVQSRAKAISSFAEKALRKIEKYDDPVNQITDLCGVRIITHTRDEMTAMCEFIEKHFDIDWENSSDISRRLKPSEFGYRSVHYIIGLKPEAFPTDDIKISLSDNLFGLKAEVQVRTILEHAWADFSHDLSYKSTFTIPDKWQRMLATLAAVLEDADNLLVTIKEGLKTYASSYGTYMTKEEIQEEIETLELVLEYDKENYILAHRIGKLAINISDWQKAIDLLSKYVDSGYAPLLRDLGVAICKRHRGDPDSAEYKQGQNYLEKASSPPNKDSDALASLAGTWKGIDEKKEGEYYRRAFEVDPYDPYPLGNYLQYKITEQHSIEMVSLIRPVIELAMKRCRNQAEVGMNIPWAFYDLGKFHLLLDESHKSVIAHAKAIQLSLAPFMIDTSLKSIEKLDSVKESLQGYEWVRRLLLLGMIAKFPDEPNGYMEEIRNLKSKECERFKEPVVIIAGGCDAQIEKQMHAFLQFLIEGFRGFNGTIISGGTKSGISGLAGAIGKIYKENIQSIGYIPKYIPANTKIDKRYSQIIYTECTDFSPFECLQCWIDLMNFGIKPNRVKVLGINGGDITAVEYRIALALGVQLGIIKGSGREADKLLTDEEWNTSEGLVTLSDKGITELRKFIGL